MGHLPVHYAMLYWNFEASTLLVENHLGELDAAYAEHSHLHLALGLFVVLVPDEFIRLVIERVPGCLTMTDEHGDLPLHFAVDCRESFDRIRLILDGYPGALEVKTSKSGFLPLHHKAHRGGRIEVLQELIPGYPMEFQTLIVTGTYPSILQSPMRRSVLRV